MSDTKNLPRTVSSETAVQLHHGGSQRAGALIDSAMANLSREQVQVLSGKAAEEALRLEVKIREQNIDYVNGKKLVEDHIDTFAMLDKQGRLTRQVVDSTIKTGAGEMRITSKSGATCFVATATYGDQDHPNVRFLRAWRDSYLAHRPAGVAFIDWYWRTGPKLATLVTRVPSLKIASRTVLTLLVLAIRLGWRERQASGHKR